MSPRIIEREIAHAGYLTIERLRLRFADGAEAFREVESHGDAAAVLPYDAERRCALVVRLFRAPVLIAAGEIFLEEACAGMIELECFNRAPVSFPCALSPLRPEGQGRWREG